MGYDLAEISIFHSGEVFAYILKAFFIISPIEHLFDFMSIDVMTEKKTFSAHVSHRKSV